MTEVKGNFRDWWRPPRKYGIDSSTRSVSFLELFYDLVYVVVIAELGHSFSSHLNLQGVLEFGFLFFLIWWGWFNGALYHDLHGNNDIRTRFFTFLQMGIVISLAVFTHDAFDEGFKGFFTSIAMFTLIFAYLWWRVGVHDPLHRPASQPYAMTYLSIAILFLVSVFLPDPMNIYLVVATTVLVFLFPFLTASRVEQVRNANQRTEILSPAAVERFGLLTIIVLGEVIVGVVQGIAEVEDLTIKVGVTAGLGLMIAISTWWLYFDLLSHHQPKESSMDGYAWIFLHLPFSATIASMGAVVLNIVEHSNEELESNLVNIFIGSIVVMLITLILIAQVIKIPEVHTSLYRRVTYVIAIAILLIVSLLFVSLDPIPFLGLIVLFQMLPIIYGLKVWIYLYRENPEFRKTFREF